MKYPIGIQNFESLRKDGYVYVDKTRHVFNLANEGRYYFLCRPRRFGKSLLISTMEAYFSGKKELFEGLDIYSLEKEWAVHPIFHIDLNTADYKEEGSLALVLNDYLSKWEELYGSSASEQSLPLRFKGVVERAQKKTGKRVVILIDEYDKPILQTISNPELQERYRDQLKAFYSVLKTQDGFIKFAFLTGVSKFGKLSVFSDLNNLQDISMDNRYIDICGITEEEIHRYFEPSIKELASANSMTYEEVTKKLKEQYDGYHFKRNSIGIYNPFSLLNTLAKQEFNDYWFETGTPSFLIELLKRSNYELPDMTTEPVSDDLLNSIDSASKSPLPLIYQSGYLTIKGYDERFKRYRLGFPNKEVETGFLNYLLPYYAPGVNRTEFELSNFVLDVESGRPEKFMERLKAMFADTSYKIAGNAELYFQNAMYLIFKIIGFYIDVERDMGDGRMDAVVRTDKYIYIFEFKLDKSADEAFKQIEDKGYATPFASDSRQLYKIGVNFSSKTRGVEEYKIEEVIK